MILGLIIVFVVLVYIYRSKTERFDTEEEIQSENAQENTADSYIVMYDIKSNLGKNLQNTAIDYLYPKNNSTLDDNIDIQLYYKSETTSTQHLEAESIIYELRENGLYLNDNAEIDTSDTFAPGEFPIQIAYNGANGIWILTTFNKIYSYTINEGFIEYSEPIEHVKTDPPLLIFGNMNKHDILYYITTKGSLYNLYSKDPILDYKNGEFVLRVSHYKNTVAYITSSYQIYIYDLENNESRQVARGSNSLLAANNTHVFYVKEIESEHYLYKLNHKVVDSKEELCLYGELRPGTGLGGGGISDLSILDTLKSGNIVAYVLSQKLECSKTQNYVDFMDEEGKHTCVCKEHHFRSEAENNTCIPCNKSKKRINTPDTKIFDTCAPLNCEVNLTRASTANRAGAYQNTNHVDKNEIGVDEKNIFNTSRQTDPTYNIVSFNNSDDELCSTFVYGGTTFSKHSPYLQFTKSGYIFREEDYIKTIQNSDIITYNSLSNMATMGETNMKNWKIDEIDQRAIIQDEINSICFENTALSSVLGKDELCPRPEKTSAKCPFDSLLFEDKACQKVPPGTVIDTENEPIYDSLGGHRITKYNECPAQTFAYMNECKPCEAGSFSGAMSTECSVCEPGSIVNLEKDGCDQCAAGTFMQGIECVSCPAGTFSRAMSTECSVCEPGSIVNLEQDGCDQCAAGTFMEGIVCVSCPAGTFSRAMSTECSACEPGSIANLEQDGCEKCSNNTYNTDGLTGTNYGNGPICEYCEGRVNENATECNRCDATTEKVVPWSGCERCPSGQRATTHPDQRNCVPDCELMIYRKDGLRYHIRSREFGYNSWIDLNNLLWNGERIDISPPLENGDARMRLTNTNECAIKKSDGSQCQINTNIHNGQEWVKGKNGDNLIGWHTKNMPMFKFTNKINGDECAMGMSPEGMEKNRGGYTGNNRGAH
jgi:hypothetical protein